MAQSVGYFEDFATPEREQEAYSEGPFVCVNANGWRIECEVKGGKCPAMPDLSIYRMREKAGFKPGKRDRWEEIVAECDWLNQKVRDGEIVLLGKRWVAPKFDTL